MIDNFLTIDKQPFINRQNNKASKQQGVVLVVSLVFLVALTAVAGALMQNTTTDIKMAGASDEKVIATQQAISAVDEIIDNQVNVRAINLFAQGLNNVATYTSADLLPAATKTGASASASVIGNPFFEAIRCPRANVGAGNSYGTIDCNHMQLQVQRLYGRNNTSTVVIDADIAQQLIGKNRD